MVNKSEMKGKVVHVEEKKPNKPAAKSMMEALKEAAKLFKCQAS